MSDSDADADCATETERGSAIAFAFKPLDAYPQALLEAGRRAVVAGDAGAAALVLAVAASDQGGGCCKLIARLGAAAIEARQTTGDTPAVEILLAAARAFDFRVKKLYVAAFKAVSPGAAQALYDANVRLDVREDGARDCPYLELICALPFADKPLYEHAPEAQTLVRLVCKIDGAANSELATSVAFRSGNRAVLEELTRVGRFSQEAAWRSAQYYSWRPSTMRVLLAQMRVDAQAMFSMVNARGGNIDALIADLGAGWLARRMRDAYGGSAPRAIEAARGLARSIEKHHHRRNTCGALIEALGELRPSPIKPARARRAADAATAGVA